MRRILLLLHSNRSSTSTFSNEWQVMGFKKCTTYSYKGNSCFVLTNGISMFVDHLGLLLRFNRTIVGLRATAGRALVVAVAGC
jgi:hypothetical protein